MGVCSRETDRPGGLGTPAPRCSSSSRRPCGCALSPWVTKMTGVASWVWPGQLHWTPCSEAPRLLSIISERGATLPSRTHRAGSPGDTAVGGQEPLQAPWEAAAEEATVGGSGAEGLQPGAPQEGGICLNDQVGRPQPLCPSQVPCSSRGSERRGGVPEEGLCPSLIITRAQPRLFLESLTQQPRDSAGPALG